MGLVSFFKRVFGGSKPQEQPTTQEFLASKKTEAPVVKEEKKEAKVKKLVPKKVTESAPKTVAKKPTKKTPPKGQ